MNASSGTNSITMTGLTFATKPGEPPVRTPKEILATRAVEVKDGWLGQIVMDGEIVYESREAHSESSDALDEVNDHVHGRLKWLITGSLL